MDRPSTVRTPLTEAYWDAAAAGALLLQHCTHCGAYQHYPRSLCTACWAPAPEWVEASGEGRIVTFTDVHRSGHPSWNRETPYSIAIVELGEGPRLLVRVDPAEGMSVGDDVRLSDSDADGVHRFVVVSREGR